MLNALKKKLQENVAHAAEAIKLPEDERNKRLDICKNCEHLGKMDFCKLCNCYMPVKTYMPGQSCPLKKWVAIKIVENTNV